MEDDSSSSMSLKEKIDEENNRINLYEQSDYKTSFVKYRNTMNELTEHYREKRNKEIEKAKKREKEKEKKCKEQKRQQRQEQKEKQQQNKQVDKNENKSSNNNKSTNDDKNGNWITLEGTAYHAMCSSGCTGTTRTGIDVSDSIYHKGKRIVAVAPNQIPLGSTLIVKYGNIQFKAIAMDTGDAISYGRLDILMSTKQEADSFGRREVKVRILKRGE